MKNIQEDQKFICQVCGRAVKAKKGVIAHHGYTRPGDGWQTKSCDGARYLPYEVSCDRLREVFEWRKAFLATQEEKLADHRVNPPETITFLERVSAWREPEEKTFTKPENFNPKGYLSSSPKTYDCAWRRRESDYIMIIRAVKAEIELMEHRLQEWKAPATAQ